jgi:hypothetical protein
VVGQAPPSRRERPGRDRSGRLAPVDLPGPARPGARHHLRPHPRWTARHAQRLDRHRACRARRPGLEGENTRLTCPIKNTRGVELTAEQRTINACTRPPEHWPNVETPCSRPPSKDYAGSPCAQGGSARSPPRHWSCSTTNTTAPHDHPGKPAPTDKGSLTPRYVLEQREESDGPGLTGSDDASCLCAPRGVGAP